MLPVAELDLAEEVLRHGEDQQVLDAIGARERACFRCVQLAAGPLEQFAGMPVVLPRGQHVTKGGSG